MRASLFVDEEKVRYLAPSVREVGTVRYAPSFEVCLADIRIIGYVPRLIADEESGFLVIVTTAGNINYFNLDVAGQLSVAKLKKIFKFKLENLPAISFEEINWHSFIVYPQELAGQPLFKSWNWFTIRGFLKNLGKALSLDNPSWEQLTSEAQAYLAEKF